MVNFQLEVQLGRHKDDIERNLKESIQKENIQHIQNGETLTLLQLINFEQIRRTQKLYNFLPIGVKEKDLLQLFKL